MRIVGTQSGVHDALSVHTVDIWYSRRREVWIVERLSAEGDQIGPAFVCGSEPEAASCLEEWLRAHEDVQLISPGDPTAAETRILSRAEQARAA